MTTHRLPATPATVHWGYFDAAIPPALVVDSGDTVALEAVNGMPDTVPPAESGLIIAEALARIHASLSPRLGTHILTGPIGVSGAVPGDMLEVRVEAVDLDADWGFCGVHPLGGTLPEDFPERHVTHIAIDRARGIGRLPFGADLKLAPFFGIMGTAPRRDLGSITSREPHEHGGNIDNKELIAGSTLFLPVWVPGANFSAGDGHAAQGDGEVCFNGLETGVTGTFTLILHKGDGAKAPLLRYPRAETPSHYISMGLDQDLDLAVKLALREMIAFICDRSGLSRLEAYKLCSLAVDFRITQATNGMKGVHGMLRKGLLF